MCLLFCRSSIMFTFFSVTYRTCEANSMAVSELQVLHSVWWHGSSGQWCLLSLHYLHSLWFTYSITDFVTVAELIIFLVNVLHFRTACCFVTDVIVDFIWNAVILQCLIFQMVGMFIEILLTVVDSGNIIKKFIFVHLLLNSVACDRMWHVFQWLIILFECLQHLATIPLHGMSFVIFFACGNPNH